MFKNTLIFIFLLALACTNSKSQTAIWGEKFSGINADVSSSVFTDSDDNIYVVGNFWSPTLTFNNGKSVMNSGTVNGFLAKFDKDSICQWATAINSTDQAIVSNLTIDGNDNIIIVGNFRRANATFNNGKFVTVFQETDSFVAKYDSEGVCQWAERISGDFNDYCRFVAVDDLDKIYIGGNFNSITLNFNNGKSVSNGSQFECFLTRYTPNGICEWALTIDGDIDDFLTGMKTDGNGNIYATGYFRSEELVFNNGISLDNTTMDYKDIFLTKYNSNGTCQWAKLISGIGNDFSGGIDIDGNGNIYISGYFQSDTLEFNNLIELIGPAGNNNIYFAKYDNNGNCKWAENIFGASASNQANIVAVDKDGYPLVGGIFDSQTLDFNNGKSLNEVGNQDVFFAKYDTTGNCQWVELIGSSEYDEIVGLNIDNFNNIILAGHSEANKLTLNNNVEIQGGQSIWGFIAKYENNNPNPVIQTLAASQITKTSAHSGGNFLNIGDNPILTKGICWSETQNPDTTDSKTNNGNGPSNFTSNMTSLTPNTTYYVRAYAVTITGVFYGNEINFKSLPLEDPELTTNQIVNITYHSAESGGTFTKQGDYQVTAKGICWSTSQNPTIANSITNNGSGASNFSSQLSNLTPETTYYVRAYATTTNGTVYGNQQTFESLEIKNPIVKFHLYDESSWNFVRMYITIDEEGDFPILQKGVCWSTNQNPTINDSKTLEGSGANNFYSTMAGLQANTTYYFRAYATTSEGTFYDSQKSYTTRDYIHPFVETAFPVMLDYGTVRTGGNFVIYGDLPITDKGICWSYSQNPTQNDNLISCGAGSNNYLDSISIPSSCSSDTIYFRTYAQTSEGIFYGNQSFVVTESNVLSLQPKFLQGFYSDTTARIVGNTIDKDGNLFIIGIFNGNQISFGNNSIAKKGSFLNSFIAKFNGQGQYLGHYSFYGNTENVELTSITIDKSTGDLIAGGNFTSKKLYFGNSTFDSVEVWNNRTSVFVVKMNNNLQKKWIEVIKGNFDQNFSEYVKLNDIKVRNQGDIVVAAISFNLDTIYCNQHSYYFSNKFNNNGFFVIYHESGLSQEINLVSETTSKIKIAIDSKDSIYFAGSYAPGTPSDGFLRKYKNNGNYSWGIWLHGSWHNGLEDIIIDKNDNVIVSGVYGYNMFLENNLQNEILNISGSNYEYFIAKYNSQGTLKWVNQFAGSSSNTNFPIAPYLAVDSLNNIYAVGSADTIITVLDFCKKFSVNNSFIDGYLVRFTPDGELDLTTQIRGNKDEFLRGISIDKYQNIWINGFTSSDTTIFSNNFKMSQTGFNNGFIAKYSIEYQPFYSQNLYLIQGWNMISTYLEPSEKAMENIFSEVLDNLVIVKDNSGQTFIPMFDINTIGDWNKFEGYQIYMEKTDTLKIIGELINPLLNQIEFKTGWYIIPYLRNGEHRIDSALKTITDKNALVIAKDNNGQTYIPEFDINSIGFMKPGEAYQIYMKEPDTLVYPKNPPVDGIEIGNQIWMKRNLDVTHYKNGDQIPFISDPNEWANSINGAWCYYNNDSTNNNLFGKLYNWYALNDPRGLAPEGWRIATDNDWIELEKFLGMNDTEANSFGFRGTNEGGKLKESSLSFWQNPNSGASNSFGFSALAGGFRIFNGQFQNVMQIGYFWTSTILSSSDPAYRYLDYNSSKIYRDRFNKNYGLSVRCVKE